MLSNARIEYRDKDWFVYDWHDTHYTSISLPMYSEENGYMLAEDFEALGEELNKCEVINRVFVWPSFKICMAHENNKGYKFFHHQIRKDCES